MWLWYFKKYSSWGWGRGQIRVMHEFAIGVKSKQLFVKCRLECKRPYFGLIPFTECVYRWVCFSRWFFWNILVILCILRFVIGYFIFSELASVAIFELFSFGAIQCLCLYLKFAGASSVKKIYLTGVVSFSGQNVLFWSFNGVNVQTTKCQILLLDQT